MQRALPKTAPAYRRTPAEFAAVLFAPRETSLTDQSKAILDRQVFYMKKYPGVALDLVGYADWVENGGDDESDMQLGLARALTVRDYLVARGHHCLLGAVPAFAVEKPWNHFAPAINP